MVTIVPAKDVLKGSEFKGLTLRVFCSSFFVVATNFSVPLAFCSCGVRTKKRGKTNFF